MIRAFTLIQTTNCFQDKSTLHCTRVLSPRFPESIFIILIVVLNYETFLKTSGTASTKQFDTIGRQSRQEGRAESLGIADCLGNFSLHIEAVQLKSAQIRKRRYCTREIATQAIVVKSHSGQSGSSRVVSKQRFDGAL